MHNSAPSYLNLRVFGCLAFVSTLSAGRNKFEPRARLCVFIGYPPGVKGYKLIDFHTHEIFISRDVIFHEDVFPFKTTNPTGFNSDPFDTIALPRLDHPIPPIIDHSHTQPITEPIPQPANTSNHAPLHPRKSTRNSKKPSYLLDYHCNQASIAPAPHSISQPLYPLSKVITYDKLSSGYKNYICNISLDVEPKYYHQAIKFPEWKQAMNEEIKALESNNTWNVVPLPPGKTPIRCKWVYKTKRNPDGTVERHKARLVAKGYNQREGIDFLDTFSPVAKLVTVKSILALAAIHNWNLHQLDISNAFLNGDLTEEVYMSLPLGYKHASTTSNSQPMVCKLIKSLYGLKQASRQWNVKLTEILSILGFVQSKAYYSLFTKGTGNNFIALLVYVDDILIAGPHIELITQFKKDLSSYFKFRDLGILKYFLGIEIARSTDGIFISQRKYTLQLLENTGLLACKHALIPMDPHTTLTSYEESPLADASQFRRIIGQLLC